MQVGVRVGALGLVGRAPVIVPDGQIVNTLRFGVQGLGLVPDALPSAVNPDVAGLDPTGTFSLRNRVEIKVIHSLPSLLLQLEVLAQYGLVGLSVLIHLQVRGVSTLFPVISKVRKQWYCQDCHQWK